MSPRVAMVDKNENGFPRVSGDEPISKPWIGCQLEFSPRERG